nr:pyridoxamine 5'-phosphate oxidase family protein [Desulfobacteraceae bacterium]
SFCVVGKTRVLPEKFATEYESAVAFGVASEVSGNERYGALVLLLEKYSPAFIEAGKSYIDQQDHATKVVKIEIEHISGKARR